MIILIACALITTTALVAIHLCTLKTRRIPPTRKVVLVTGCDHGFGNLLTRKLDKLGFQVVAGCLNNRSESVAALLNDTNHVTTVTLDVTSEMQVQDARKMTEEILRKNDAVLWAVVNNAGVAMFTECEWCPMTAYQRHAEINLLGPIRVTKVFLPLVRRAQGRVINVASQAGRVGLPGFTAYSASKFGLIGFSDCLRREMFKFGVKVITIEPMMYRTPLAQKSLQLSLLRNSWDSAKAEIKADYGQLYFEAFHHRLDQYLSLSSKAIHEVIDCMEQAITLERPSARYVPGFMVGFCSNVFSILPHWIQDACINLQMDISCKPNTVP